MAIHDDIYIFMQAPVCYKCKEATPTLIIRAQSMCKPCMLTHVEHSFRSTLRTSLQPRHQERIVVCVSGGFNSAALLHMTTGCIDRKRAARLMQFEPHVLFVDDSRIFGIAEAEVTEYIETVRATYQCPVNVVPAEEFLPDLIPYVTSNPKHFEQLYSMRFHSRAAQWAQDNGFSKVIMGDSGSRVSAKVLNLLCMGRGAAISECTALVSEIGSVTVGRPLREILGNEVGIYAHFNSLPTLNRLPLYFNPSLPSGGKIEVLVADFLTGLQSKFQSTSHNILRTSSKLKNDSLDQDCSLCGLPRETSFQELEIGKVYDMSRCYGCQKIC
mmetsp:Transcript_25824/g.45547  ORF Transcript_25824/g.45547 Transcript_25824/m.45547 type:complete len:328 (-) Transcript_25824:5994-6977(-)